MKVELVEILEEISRIENNHRYMAIQNSDNLQYLEALRSIISAEAVADVLEELKVLFALKEQDDSS